MTAGLQLRPFQRDGVEFLRARPRAFLADEMGLGKSAQLINAAADADGPVLVVAPSMVLDGGTWIDEVTKWAPDPSKFTTIPYTQLAPHGTKPPMTGGKAKPKLIPWSQGKNKWNALLRPDLPKHLGAVIFDEAHYLKGRGSLRTGLGQALAARADRVYLASGTPIPNYSHELYTLLQILNPDQAKVGSKYGAYWRWVERWFNVTPGQYSSFEIGGMRGCLPECQLRPPWDPCKHYQAFATEELGGIFLQRKRDDVLPDLPPLTRITVECPMGPKQRSAYRSMAKEYVAETEVGDEVVAWSAGSKHVMCDQITTGLGVLDRTAKATQDNAKLARLAEDLQARSRPTLVMAHYQPTVEACYQVAKDLGLRVALVYGPTSKVDRTRAIREFQAGQLDVLVGSLETLAEGLTLVAADMVIFVETSWKPSRNEQALRRVHRLGQDRPVTMLDYVTPNTVDAKKRGVLKNKTDEQMRTLTAAELARLL